MRMIIISDCNEPGSSLVLMQINHSTPLTHYEYATTRFSDEISLTFQATMSPHNYYFIILWMVMTNRLLSIVL